MCRIYAGTDPALYASSTRSVRINGHVTSIRLEQEFWNILDRIAADSGLTTAQFISTLHDEILEERRVVENFTSLLRVICNLYLARGYATPSAANPVAAEPLAASPPC